MFNLAGVFWSLWILPALVMQTESPNLAPAVKSLLLKLG